MTRSSLNINEIRAICKKFVFVNIKRKPALYLIVKHNFVCINNKDIFYFKNEKFNTKNY